MFQEIIKFFKMLFDKQERPGAERLSPGNWIKREFKFSLPKEYLTVPLTADPVCISAPIADTNSMDPVFDHDNTVIIIQGANGPDMDALRNALKAGDIAVYRTSDGGLIIHRIVEVGQDEQGKYFIFQGDNNADIKDSLKVRPENIAYINVGTFY